MSRVEEYRGPDGAWHLSRAWAVLASPAQVVGAVRTISGSIPDRYYLATAQHESNYALNERDTEENGFQSWGLYQLSKEEAREAGSPDADLLALGPATYVMAMITERRRKVMRATAGIVGADPWDMPAYLAIAHNQGLGAAVKTIQRYGMDWSAYRRRNPDIRIVTSGYGDDVCGPVPSR